MTLTELITTCGGPQNLLRALRLDDTVILELAEPPSNLPLNQARRQEKSPLTFDPVLSQLHWQPDEPLSEQAWDQLGRLIEANQRAGLAAVSETTPSLHRPAWHIAPPQGLLNDPNGFIFHQGQYHLFYQLYPFACVHKDKYWAHLTSSDLLHWTAQPMALCPSDWYDSHGVFSGHAVSRDHQLLLFYTGNVRIGEQRDRHTTQCLARSEDGLHFTKLGPVIRELPPGVTPHCRDPKVIRHGDHWLMLLGVQQEAADRQLQGRLAMYRSDNLYQWEFVGLFGDPLGEFGYMWECPDLFTLDGQTLAMLCPQGIASGSPHHQVPHHCGYVKAQLDKQDNLSLSDYATLDHGFDFYAPQTTEAPDGRRLLIGWMGLPDETEQPSRADGWLHQLTCLRELRWERGKLCQRPARELQQLRSHAQEYPSAAGNQTLALNSKSFELYTTLSWPNSGQVTLRLMDDGEHYCDLILDGDHLRIALDRRHTLPTDGETRRELAWDSAQPVALHILADHSSLEVFINQGEFVMTARVFTPPSATNIRFLAAPSYRWSPIQTWLLSAHQTQG